MKAIDLFPYWTDNRALLAEVTGAVGGADLDFRPAPGLASSEARVDTGVLPFLPLLSSSPWRLGVLGAFCQES